jgi:hypothetical protein
MSEQTVKTPERFPSQGICVHISRERFIHPEPSRHKFKRHQSVSFLEMFIYIPKSEQQGSFSLGSKKNLFVPERASASVSGGEQRVFFLPQNWILIF